MASPSIVIGKVISPFGVKGQVKVYPYTDFLERCHLLENVVVERESDEVEMVVSDTFVHKNMWIMHFQGCNSYEDALRLKGALLKIHPSERMPLPEGSYYIDEILGMEVITLEGKKLGKVYDVLKTGGNDVFVVKKSPKGREILIPVLKTVISEIDRDENFIMVDLPPGLED